MRSIQLPVLVQLMHRAKLFPEMVGFEGGGEVGKGQHLVQHSLYPLSLHPNHFKTKVHRNFAQVSSAEGLQHGFVRRKPHT